MKNVFFTFFLFSSAVFGNSSDFLGADICQYEKSGISYRESESTENLSFLTISLSSKDNSNFCRELYFKKSFPSSKKLNSTESNLLTFLFDEYLTYSLPITTSSKIVKRLIDFNLINKTQQNAKLKIERTIVELGFDLKSVEEFSKTILNSIVITDFFCIDYYTIYYSNEIERVKMVLEYRELFKEYQLSTPLTDLVFDDILKIKGEYLADIKRILILSLNDNL
jgi:hypothetical protein